MISLWLRSNANKGQMIEVLKTLRTDFSDNDYKDNREGVRCGLELSFQRNPLSVDQAMFFKAFGRPGMWEGWKPVGRQSR